MTPGFGEIDAAVLPLPRRSARVALALKASESCLAQPLSRVDALQTQASSKLKLLRSVSSHAAEFHGHGQGISARDVAAISSSCSSPVMLPPTSCMCRKSGNMRTVDGGSTGSSHSDLYNGGSRLECSPGVLPAKATAQPAAATCRAAFSSRLPKSGNLPPQAAADAVAAVGRRQTVRRSTSLASARMSAAACASNLSMPDIVCTSRLSAPVQPQDVPLRAAATAMCTRAVACHSGSTSAHSSRPHSGSATCSSASQRTASMRQHGTQHCRSQAGATRRSCSQIPLSGHGSIVGFDDPYLERMQRVLDRVALLSTPSTAAVVRARSSQVAGLIPDEA